MNAIPIWVLFIFTLLILTASLELGFRIGKRKSLKEISEKESTISTTVSAVLGLLGFLLVFTFGIVYDRYDAKRELVRNEAGEIRTCYLRSEFLPEGDRAIAKSNLISYVDKRINAVAERDMEEIKKIVNESEHIQKILWDMAVANARKDMNSDVAALYIESLNDMFNFHYLRVAVGIQARIPDGMWAMIYIMLILSMFSLGYQRAAAGSGRMSSILTMMAFAITLVVMLIASLDHPESGFITVPQQPLIDLLTWMRQGR